MGRWSARLRGRQPYGQEVGPAQVYAAVEARWRSSRCARAGWACFSQRLGKSADMYIGIGTLIIIVILLIIFVF
jgi:hypothetical protein